MTNSLNEKILPRLNGVTFFEPGSFKQSQKPDVLEDGSWVIEGEISIYDQKTRSYNQKLPFYKKKVGNKDGDIGHIFPILVCSPDFVKYHGTEIAPDTVKPIMFKEFSVGGVENYIDTRLQALGEVSFDEMVESIDEFCWATYDLGMEDWPDSLKHMSDKT